MALDRDQPEEITDYTCKCYVKYRFIGHYVNIEAAMYTIFLLEGQLYWGEYGTLHKYRCDGTRL